MDVRQQAHLSGMRLADMPELFDPSRQSSFELVIPGLDQLTLPDGSGELVGVGAQSNTNIIRLSVASHSLPSHQLNVVEKVLGNQRVKFAGKPQQNSLTLSVSDWVDAQVYEVLWAWYQKCYSNRSQKIGRAHSYKMPAYVHQYDAAFEQVIRTWEIKGCWPSNLSQDEFSAEADAQCKIQLELQYDNYDILD